MSGAASSSTTSRLQVLPQKSVNQRPTMALLSSSLDMLNSSLTVLEREMHDRLSQFEQYRRKPSAAPHFLLSYSNQRYEARGDESHDGVTSVANRVRRLQQSKIGLRWSPTA